MLRPANSFLLRIALAVGPIWGVSFNSYAGPSVPLFSDIDAGLIGDAVIGGMPAAPESRIAKSTVKLKVYHQGTIDTCSGTLIAKDLVLTAAHCLSDDPLLVVVATAEGSRAAMNYKAHDDYTIVTRAFPFALRRSDTTRNDIALLRLRRPVSSGLAAKLPARKMLTGEKTAVLIAGYGKTKVDEAAEAPSILTWAPAQAQLIMFTFKIPEAQLAITGRQLCQGDSGGPIYQVSGKDLVVIGVESYGVDGCVGEDRAVSVAHKLEWIRAAAAELRAEQEI